MFWLYESFGSAGVVVCHVFTFHFEVLLAIEELPAVIPLPFCFLFTIESLILFFSIYCFSWDLLPFLLDIMVVTSLGNMLMLLSISWSFGVEYLSLFAVSLADSPFGFITENKLDCTDSLSEITSGSFLIFLLILTLIFFFGFVVFSAKFWFCMFRASVKVFSILLIFLYTLIGVAFFANDGQKEGLLKGLWELLNLSRCLCSNVSSAASVAFSFKINFNALICSYSYLENYLGALRNSLKAFWTLYS